MPPLLTYIARVNDGLPLVASYTQEVGDHYKQEAKALLQNIGTEASRMSVETSGQRLFHYMIRDNVCYLTLTEQSYPKRLCFLYLEEISEGLVEELGKNGMDWRTQINTAARPYQFIKFDRFISAKQKEYMDPRRVQQQQQEQNSQLFDDLQDIQSIMKKNIQEVLNRGEKLEHVSNISQNLVQESKKFKWGTKKLTFQAMLNQYGPMVACGVFILFVLYMKFFRG